MALSNDIINLINSLKLNKRYRMTRFDRLSSSYYSTYDLYLKALLECKYIDITENNAYFRVLKYIPSDKKMSDIISDRKNIYKIKNRKECVNKLLHKNVVFNNTSIVSIFNDIKDKIVNILKVEYDKEKSVEIVSNSKFYVDRNYIFMTDKNNKIMLFKYENGNLIHFDYSLLDKANFKQLVAFVNII